MLYTDWEDPELLGWDEYENQTLEIERQCYPNLCNPIQYCTPRVCMPSCFPVICNPKIFCNPRASRMPKKCVPRP